MDYKNIIINIENKVALVTFNRPNALNALNSETLRELDLLITSLEKNELVDIVIFTGSNKSFIAGADISEMKDMDYKDARVYGNLGQNVFRKIEKFQKPTIAAINGYALGGGCELAMSCDLRIASLKAKFGQPEVTLGITPGFSGTQRLPRLVGLAKAKELIYTGKIISAEEALEIGLVNKVVSKDHLLEETYAMARDILKNGQLAVRYSKKAIDEGYDNEIDKGILVEASYFAKCFDTNDQKEGMNAFIEKRKANFKTE